ncbi:MAG TPA: FUN14 domain-containing protein [Nitrososphaeraceae archaeon]|nr:FUN14 domain-containing protein [Nitrososphaeraceae archaeon]
MNIDENFTSITYTISGGFFGGILLGYALKKVIRIAAVVVGLFIAGLVYLQYQQIASINWSKLEGVVTTTLANATILIDNNSNFSELAITNFGIPLTGSISAGFTIGFMKG